ncbi:uncharacterized protein [Amphiura filiformis]|uniref:uncharacterized protein n=1 Tax=Amphiura filiformis TaxID=82378 RepID=UPI003B22530F
MSMLQYVSHYQDVKEQYQALQPPGGISKLHGLGITVFNTLVSSLILISIISRPTKLIKFLCVFRREQQQALQPLGGKSWGGSLADYGGIGGLSHLGIHRVKDLPVSRSHRHYQSGLTKHDGGPQPYTRTQLKLSECRVNDQSLTQPLQTDPSMIGWEAHNPSSWPGFHAYTSHRPRFEVFPTGGDDKPQVTAAQSAPGTRMSQPLSETTRSAISDINRRLYQRTSYQDSFPDYTRELRLTAAKSLPSRLKKLGVIAVANSEYGDSMYLPMLTDGTESTLTDRTLKTRELEYVDENEDRDGDKEEAEEQNAPDDEREDVEEADAEIAAMPSTPPPSASRGETESDTSRQKSRSTNKSVSFVETPQVMEDTIRKFDITPNKPMTGVGPNWPPSTSQVINSINGSQLLERNDITQYPPAYRSALKQLAMKTQKGRTKSTAATSTVSPESVQKQRPPTPNKSRKSTKTTAVVTNTGPPPAPPQPPPLTRQQLAAKRSAPLQPLNASQKALAMLSQYDEYDDDLYRELNLPDGPNQPFVVPHSYRHSQTRRSAPSSLPALKKTKSKVFNWSAATNKRSLPLPPAPLSDCLTPAGRRVPHRLGLRYKTEAHKRYHSVHPESVPDLRNSRMGNGEKRYFFYDSHSSVYRG